MITRILEFIRKNAMITPGQRVLAGVSGGMDSAALLHILAALSGKLGFTLEVVHFNHGIRPESQEEEQFVTGLCEGLSVPVHIGRADVPALAHEQGISLELAAREARHAFFRQTMEQQNIGVLALAHHMDDQAETMLLRLARGAGALGLGAMAPVNGRIIRPLLCVSRQDIALYCAENRLQWREDCTNSDTAIPRNWVRRELLPLIRQHLNSSAAQALCRTAALLRQDEDFFHPIVQEALRDAEPCMGGWALPVSGLPGLHPAVRSRALRLLCQRAGRDRDVELGHIADIEALLQPGMTGRRIDLGGGFVAWREFDRIVVAESLPEVQRFCLPVAVPGDTETPRGVLRITMLDAVQGDLKHHGPMVQYMDMDTLPPDTVARTRLPGDTIHPLGAPGRRKLKEYLIDRKISRLQRDTLLLLAHEADILWVAGQAMADSVKVTDQSKRIIKIEWITNGEEPKSGEHD